MATFYTTKGIKEMTMVVKPTYTTLVNGFPVVTQGKRIRFAEGMLETDDKDEIKFLRTHKNFNSNFFEDKEETAKLTAKVKV